MLQTQGEAAGRCQLPCARVLAAPRLSAFAVPYLPQQWLMADVQCLEAPCKHSPLDLRSESTSATQEDASTRCDSIIAFWALPLALGLQHAWAAAGTQLRSCVTTAFLARNTASLLHFWALVVVWALVMSLLSLQTCAPR